MESFYAQPGNEAGAIETFLQIGPTQSAKGPWFSVKLPAADYRVTATFGNHRNVRLIQLARKHQTLILSWTV